MEGIYIGIVLDITEKQNHPVCQLAYEGGFNILYKNGLRYYVVVFVRTLRANSTIAHASNTITKPI
ncbi:MAG: hypothetical protein WCT33_02685, partial [Patescibacteria group bacterium]